MRSDEVALLMYRQKPITLFRLFGVDFETNDTLVENIDSPEVDWQFLFDDLRAASGLMTSGFELFCYRGQNTYKPFLPSSSFKSYTDAKKQASRALNAVFVHSSTAEMNICTIALVSEKVSDQLFATLNKGSSKQKRIPMNLESLSSLIIQPIDTWQMRYTDQMGDKMYQQTKRFPLVTWPPTSKYEMRDYRAK